MKTPRTAKARRTKRWTGYLLIVNGQWRIGGGGAPTLYAKDELPCYPLERGEQWEHVHVTITPFPHPQEGTEAVGNHTAGRDTT